MIGIEQDDGPYEAFVSNLRERAHLVKGEEAKMGRRRLGDSSRNVMKAMFQFVIGRYYASN